MHAVVFLCAVELTAKQLQFAVIFVLKLVYLRVCVQWSFFVLSRSAGGRKEWRGLLPDVVQLVSQHLNFTSVVCVSGVLMYGSCVYVRRSDVWQLCVCQVL